MRARLLTILIALMLTGGAYPARAQEAGKIVEQYVKAAGGGRALAKIQTLTLEGRFASDDGKTGTYTLDTKLPNRYYSELLIGEKNLIEAYNGKSAWHQNAAGELGTLVGSEGMQLEAAAQYYNSRLVNPKKSKIALTFVGHAQVRGRDALQTEITTATGVKRQIFFDSQTHLIVKEAATVGGVDEEISYDDYRTIQGVKLPHKIELHRESDKYDISVTRAVINGTVGERVFDFPKKSQVQLPDLKALFKEIDDNQKAIDKIKENYTGTRAEEETEFESNGKVKKREVTEYTFFYLNGEEVSTVVKKDGKALSDVEQKKENEKTQKRIEELQKRETKKKAKEEKAKEEGKSDEKDEPGIEIFLRACQFVNPRRERFRGQDVLVFDFEPNPEFKAHKMVEKIVQKLAGVVWIDEKAHDVARLEAYFVGDMRFAGGLLANLEKGTSFVMEQAYVNNEVWLPTYDEAHVGVRVLLLKGIKVNAVTRYSDYKKFNVETLSTIAKPKGAAEAPADPPAKPQ
ncbi:MAG TPA: hypothetical protein VK937_19500 [Candidatus Limnocylindria bacterium]|jgi:hypothetical protein|nr:hypothetical protein [Candidatus Limnocylindria bacterium]